MKVIKPFVVIIIFVFLLASCQKRGIFHTNHSINHYEKIMDYFANIEDNSVNEIILQYILNQLKKSDAIIEEFPITIDKENSNINIICRFYPQYSRRILLITPYIPAGLDDTAYRRAETERIAFNVGLMLETTSMLSSHIPDQFGVDLVFLGSEGNYNTIRSYNKAFHDLIANYGKTKPEIGIYLMLHSSQKLSIPIDDHSYQKLPYIVHRVWTTAEKLGWKEFETSLVASSLFEGEELLYRDLNTIKLKNIYEEDKEVLPENLIVNYRILGSLFSELIYGKDK
ncbi:MAG: hypothetical protein K0B81_08095 [Candidatus Cloacimonetes bacterium]|nr:hypothetical protein [Candidatus Cloacimonadota bacterium]